MVTWEYLEVMLNTKEGWWRDSIGREGELARRAYGLMSFRYASASLLNELGAEGWELVGYDADPVARWILKRPSSQV